MLRRTLLSWGVTLSLLGLLASNALTATYAAAAPVSQTTPSATPTPVAVDTFDPSAAGGRTVVKWYVGLGTGGNPSRSKCSAPLSTSSTDRRTAFTCRCRSSTTASRPRRWRRRSQPATFPTSSGPWARSAARRSMATTSIWRPTFSPVRRRPESVRSRPSSTPTTCRARDRSASRSPSSRRSSTTTRICSTRPACRIRRRTMARLYMGREWNLETVRDIAKILTVDEEGNDANEPELPSRPGRPVRLGPAVRDRSARHGHAVWPWSPGRRTGQCPDASCTG